MRKLAPFLFLTAVSCSGVEPIYLQEDGSSVHPVTLRSAFSGKTACSYLFFDEDGFLLYSFPASRDTATFLLRQGSYSLFSFKNVPTFNLTGLSSLGDLSVGTVGFSDNREGDEIRLPLFGKVTADIDMAGPTNVTVPLGRYVFRIKVRSVRNEFDYPLEYSEVNYLGAFLENVPSSVHLDGSPSEDCDLISKGGRCKSGFILSPDSKADDFQEPLLTVLDSRTSPVPIPSYETVQIQSDYLYSFPECKSAKLRIVVALDIDGQVLYYPVDLSDLQSNESVALDLTVRKPGSDDPDKPVLGAQAAMLEPLLFEDGPVLDLSF